jgi:hypothetical protein
VNIFKQIIYYHKIIRKDLDFTFQNLALNYKISLLLKFRAVGLNFEPLKQILKSLFLKRFKSWFEFFKSFSSNSNKISNQILLCFFQKFNSLQPLLSHPPSAAQSSFVFCSLRCPMHSSPAANQASPNPFSLSVACWPTCHSTHAPGRAASTAHPSPPWSLLPQANPAMSPLAHLPHHQNKRHPLHSISQNGVAHPIPHPTTLISGNRHIEDVDCHLLPHL